MANGPILWGGNSTANNLQNFITTNNAIGGSSGARNYLQNYYFFNTDPTIGIVTTLTATGNRTTRKIFWGSSTTGLLSYVTSTPLRYGAMAQIAVTGAAGAQFVETPMFTLDPADIGQLISISFDLNTSGTFATGDCTIAIIRYNSSGTYQATISPSTTSLPTGLNFFQATFSGSATASDQYSVRFLSNNASLRTFDIDSLKVGSFVSNQVFGTSSAPLATAYVTSVWQGEYAGTNPQVGGSSPFQMTNTNNPVMVLNPSANITLYMPTGAIATTIYCVKNISPTFSVTIAGADAATIAVLWRGVCYLHNNGSNPGLGANWVVDHICDSGVYLPTYSSQTGFLTGTITNHNHIFSRVNQTVSVSGTFSNTGGTSGFIGTILISLPITISTNFTDTAQSSGTGSIQAAGFFGIGVIFANTSVKAVQLNAQTNTNVTGVNVFYTFSYQII